MRGPAVLVMILVALSAPCAGAQALFETAADDTTTVEPVPDTLLSARLETIFSNIEEFAGVTVSVTEGVVKLDGAVDQPEARRSVEALARRIPGVVYVVNDVEASTDVETRVTPAVDKIREYWDTFVSQLPVLAVALIVVLLFASASFLIGRWKKPARWMGINPLAWGFLSRLVRAILVAVGLVLAFDILGIASLMGAVLGTAGIVGIAIGFAFQDIVENYLAGMLLSIRRPFSVNDLVRVGEFEGRIIRMTSRELVLLTLEGNHVRLPNAHIFKSPFTNFSVNPRRLFSIEIGIGVNEDLKRAMAIGVERLRTMPGVIADPEPFARVQELGESSVVVRYHGWVNQHEADFLKVRSEGVRLLKAALDEGGVELPEPIYRVITQTKDERGPSKKPPENVEDPTAEDVRPDGKLEEQVREDLARSDDENLLE